MEISKLDMISNMPDPILHSILSRLPTTEEVIRTSILSTRWRYLWTSVPSINIPYFQVLESDKESKKNRFKEFVCRILEINSLDLDSFTLCCMDHFDMSIVGRWINAAVRRNVKLLDLMFCGKKHKDDVMELPHCGSLEVLKLSLLDYRITFPKFTGFPALRVLELDGCKLLNYGLVNDFLKSLKVLEELSLIDCKTCDFYFLSISCPKLKNLRIDNRILRDSFGVVYGTEDLFNRVEICCPKLVFLEFGGFMAEEIIFGSLDSLKKAVIHPHDNFEWSVKGICDLFAGITHVESLSLHICLDAEFDLENLPKSLPNLKTLELTIRIDDSMEDLIQILACSPNLESLDVIIKEDSWLVAEGPEFDLEDIECTFEQLKMITVTGLSAYTYHLGFVKFLLERTPFLETMNITPCVNTSVSTSFLETMIMPPHVKMRDYGILSLSTKVLSLPRASTEADILFLSDQV